MSNKDDEIVSTTRSGIVETLTTSQRAALDEIFERTKHLFPAESKDTLIVRCLRDQAFFDRHLLRFLKRDDFQTEKSIGRLQETMLWRKSLGLDEGPVDIEALRNDPETSPVYHVAPFRTKKNDVVMFHYLQIFDAKTVKTEKHLKFFVGVTDSAVEMLGDNECVVCFANLANLSWGASIATSTWDPILTAMRKHYPETINRVLILNPMMWFKITFGMVKMFIGRKTINKFKVYGNEYKQRMRKYIEPEQLPVQWNMGGRYNANYGPRAPPPADADDIPTEEMLRQLKLNNLSDPELDKEMYSDDDD